jgi:hypothetical protein
MGPRGCSARVKALDSLEEPKVNRQIGFAEMSAPASIIF